MACVRNLSQSPRSLYVSAKPLILHPKTHRPCKPIPHPKHQTTNLLLSSLYTLSPAWFLTASVAPYRPIDLKAQNSTTTKPLPYAPMDPKPLSRSCYVVPLWVSDGWLVGKFGLLPKGSILETWGMSKPPTPKPYPIGIPEGANVGTIKHTRPDA